MGANTRLARRVVGVVSVGIGAMALGGCSGGASSVAGGVGTERASGQTVVVSSHLVAGLGRVLVDGADRTLYAYVPDGRGRSRCYRHCAEVWPPLLIPNGSQLVAGGGVRTSLLGTTRRRDGQDQVTYGHRPLYLYELDAAPGEASGQGDDMGLWYVVDADGALDRRPLPKGAAS